ncbi:MAG: hypothetical protein R3B98_07110 [Hyphomonas sp.]
MDYTYDRGGLGAPLVVSIHEDRIGVSAGNGKGREVLFDDIRALRYFTTSSPQRTDYTLVISGGGRPLELNFINSLTAGADPARAAAFNRAVAASLAAIAKARPELEVQSGRGPVAATLIFLCFAIPAAMGLTGAALFRTEPGGGPMLLSCLGIGAVSALFAWRARPWKKSKPIRVGDLAALFAPEPAQA